MVNITTSYSPENYTYISNSIHADMNMSYNCSQSVSCVVKHVRFLERVQADDVQYRIWWWLMMFSIVYGGG